MMRRIVSDEECVERHGPGWRRVFSEATSDADPIVPCPLVARKRMGVSQGVISGG